MTALTAITGILTSKGFARNFVVTVDRATAAAMPNTGARGERYRRNCAGHGVITMRAKEARTYAGMTHCRLNTMSSRPINERAAKSKTAWGPSQNAFRTDLMKILDSLSSERPQFRSAETTPNSLNQRTEHYARRGSLNDTGRRDQAPAGKRIYIQNIFYITNIIKLVGGSLIGISGMFVACVMLNRPYVALPPTDTQERY